MGTTAAMRDMEYTLYLTAHEQAALCARLALAAKLVEWQMTELLEDAKLITSELVTNSAKLGQIFTLRFHRRADNALRIEVEDSSPELPKVDDPLADLDRGDFDDNGGRGLFLVAAVADSWGYRLTGTGKIVWAVLTCH